MTTGDLVLGVDLGTTALKGGVFGPAGACLAFAQAEYPLYAPHDGWAEQDADDWWSAFEAVVAGLAVEVDLQRVAALCVVAQSPTVAPIGAGGTPLGRAITWADRRAEAKARWLGERLGHEAVNVAFDVLPRAIWIRDHLPDVYRQTRWFMQAFDYLPYRLTGRPVAIRPLPGAGPWAAAKLAAADLDPGRFPDATLAPGEVIGCVRADVAERLGLSPDTMVISGNVDAFSHWIGVDLSRAGTLCNIGGTSEGASLAWHEALADPKHRVFSLPSPFGRGAVIGGAMSNSGGLLDWSVRNLGAGSTRESALAAMAACPAGSAGLIALPYFMGERTPIYDPAARGAYVGLTRDHTGAHMGRALLESVAFALRQVLDVLADVGAEVRDITVTGGTAHAGLWNSIKADVTGLPVRVTDMKASGVLGAAILARAAATGSALADVSQEMVAYTEVIEPNIANKAVYDDVYPLFLDLYESLRPTFTRLAGLAERA